MLAVKAKIYGVLYKQSSSIVLSRLMKHLVIGQGYQAPNFSAFHWSPHGRLVSIGQNFITTRVVHLPKRTKTSLITKADLITSYCSYAWHAQPGPIWTRLCGSCIAVIAGYPVYLELCLLPVMIICKAICGVEFDNESFQPVRFLL